jgi:hypothetical protein
MGKLLERLIDVIKRLVKPGFLLIESLILFIEL